MGLIVLALAWWFLLLQHYARAEPYVPENVTMASKKAQSAGSGQSSKDGTFMDLRDSFVPLFSGQPADYRERSTESVLNIVGSFTGVTWRLFQDWGHEVTRERRSL